MDVVEMERTDEHFLLDGEEFVITPALRVRCDGGGGPLGHPVEYITLEKGGQAVCKYCDRRFLHSSHPEVARVRAEGRPFAP
ncbi:hypothetical protein HRbin40_01816 [bacterium HR40]|nr:hypothetical protein HRbin40_01816 [bacterium HR40]